MSGQQAAPSQKPCPPSFRYAFSLAGNVKSQEIGSNPTGKLIDIDYVNLYAKTKAPKDVPYDVSRMNGAWQGIKGRVIAGSDWATFRTDGVIEFNGRLTLRTKEPKPPSPSDTAAATTAAATIDADTESNGDDDDDDDDSILINVIVSGVVDVLSDYGDLTSNREDRLIAWSGDATKPPLPLALAIRFELAQATEPWISNEYPQRNYEKYAQLIQSPFVGCGTATFNGHIPSKVDLDILQVIPGWAPKVDTKPGERLDPPRNADTSLGAASRAAARQPAAGRSRPQ